MAEVHVTVSCFACSSPHAMTMWPGTTKVYVCPVCNSLNLVARTRAINLTSGETVDHVLAFSTEPASLTPRSDV
jgi:hypothetical protein